MSDLWADAFLSLLEAAEAAGDPDCVRAVYQPASLPAATVLVHIERGVSLQPAGFDAQVISQAITIEAALPALGKEPARGETFTTPTGTVYTVVTVLENDGHIVKVQVVK